MDEGFLGTNTVGTLLTETTEWYVITCLHAYMQCKLQVKDSCIQILWALLAETIEEDA
jgi:hypothetical protein